MIDLQWNKYTLYSRSNLEPLVRQLATSILAGPQGFLPGRCAVIFSISDAYQLREKDDWSDKNVVEISANPDRGRLNSPGLPSGQKRADWHKLLAAEKNTFMRSIEAHKGETPGTLYTETYDLAMTLCSTLANACKERGIDSTFCEFTVSGFLFFDLMIVLPTCIESSINCHLADQILAVYLTGAIPCGWAGKFPDGGIIAYWPYSAEVEFERDGEGR